MKRVMLGHDESRANKFTDLRRLPARLTLEQAADDMGFNPGDVPILVVAKLLKPLGHPAPNGQKYFSSAELDRLRNDAEWLGRASGALIRHWRKRNALRKANHTKSHP
jgi:hypothetical protein